MIVLKEQLILFGSWHPPLDQFVTLNTEGSVQGNPGTARGGGLIRDRFEKWIYNMVLHTQQKHNKQLN